MSDLYRRAISSAVALVCGALSSSVPAALVPYTDRSAFDAAVAALPNVSRVAEGYDGATAGELIGNGATLRGLTYTYGASGNNLEGSGVWMKVSTGFGTTSPPNFLGTSDGGVFQSGDNFSLGFGAARAIGMYFISNDSLFVTFRR